MPLVIISVCERRVVEMAHGVGSPCGACKFLRRKCNPDCIFAPYFRSEQGPATFSAIHKVFGASNVSKLLLHVPVQDRCEAVVTIAYEAQARLRDPVYGCVSHIFALQQQVAILQAQLMRMKTQLANTVMNNNINTMTHNLNDDKYFALRECQGVTYTLPNLQAYYNNNLASCQSSVESMEQENVGLTKEEMICQSEQLTELQELAFKMMRD